MTLSTFVYNCLFDYIKIFVQATEVTQFLQYKVGVVKADTWSKVL